MDKRIPDAVIRRAWMDPSMTSAAAARSVGLSRVHLWVRAKALNLPARQEGRPPVIPVDELEVLWRANVMVRDIAALYGCPFSSVRQLARRHGLPARPKGKHAPISLAEYRAALVRRANMPTNRPTEAERTILHRARPQ